MGVKLDMQRFAGDYREGLTDRELLAKYKISAQDLVTIVKKLIQGGQISKEEYFNRNRKIDALKALREKDFLKSLHHCPVCSHIHPTPFTTCPACGTDIAEYQEAERSEEMAIERAILEKYAAESPVLLSPDEGDAKKASTFAEQPQAGTEASRQMAPVPVSLAIEIPEVFQAKVGMLIEDLRLLDGHAYGRPGSAFQLQEVVSSDSFSALFKARTKSTTGIPVLVKIFDPVLLPQAHVEEFLQKVIDYQSGMSDINILKVVGRGTAGADTALLYEYMPTNLENLVGQHAEGLPLEMMMEILPQVLNALGYSHMHRGADGKVARLSHLHLRPSKFLFDENKQVVKLEDCAVWRSLVEVRGYKRHLSEEPGVDLSALAPESFVIESKFVNAFLVDIYALGVLLYRLATGRNPFFGSNYEEYRFEHLRKFPIPPRVHRYTIPAWLDEMILKCLEKEPGQRWRSATQMELAIRKDVLQ